MICDVCISLQGICNNKIMIFSEKEQILYVLGTRDMCEYMDFNRRSS